MIVINCAACNKTTVKRSGMQKYCRPCSEARSAERAKGRGGARRAQDSKFIERGLAISKAASRTSLVDDEAFDAGDGWVVKFKIPFSGAASKNHVWSLGKGGGHVFKRMESRSYQDVIAYQVKQATRGLPVCNNKIWIDLFVQKPHHKGDAINVIDVVCDGLKVGLGIDDRWFCIRKVDWEIAKNDPQIFVSVYQPDAFEARACSHCGRVLSLDNFGANKTATSGVGRVCRECRNARKPKEAA
jgi:hypothetical protein